MHLKTSRVRLLGGALAVAALASLSGQASAQNLVVNGGFETGSFSGWTQTGDTTFNGVQCGVSVPEGSCDGFFGPVGTLGGIQQAIATTVGQLYSVSFVLKSDASAGSFMASFGGANLLTLSIASAGTTTFSLTTAATSASTLLSFQFRDDLGFLELDGVQVTAVPEPASWALMGLGLLAFGARRMRDRR